MDGDPRASPDAPRASGGVMDDGGRASFSMEFSHFQPKRQ